MKTKTKNKSSNKKYLRREFLSILINGHEVVWLESVNRETNEVEADWVIMDVVDKETWFCIFNYLEAEGWFDAIHGKEVMDEIRKEWKTNEEENYI